MALEAAARKEPQKERTPRGDWAQLLRKTFDFDVFTCVRCGGRRRVLAYLKEGGGVGAIVEHLDCPWQVRAWPQREGHRRPATGWNRSEAAKRLGIPVRTLSYRMKVLELKKP